MAVKSADIGLDSYKFGFHDDIKPVYKSPKGLSADIVREISRQKDEPEWMLEFRLESLRQFESKPDADVGRGPVTHRFRRHLLLHPPPRPTGAQLGRRAGRHQEHVRPPGHSRGGAQVPGRRGRAVRLGSRLPQHPRGPGTRGRGVPRHGLRAARAPGDRARVLRHDHPQRRQQVRRAQQRGVERRELRLRPRGREGRGAAAGVFPHQRGEHGAVRAHADRRGARGLRALRGGLHGADLRDGLAALGGGGDRRQRRRALPLHDYPELVDGCLQPGDEARGGLPRRHDGVDRRQPG